MRVGIVSPYSFGSAGGVQNHVLGLAGWLLEAGHDVHLFAPGTPSPDLLQRHRVPASRFTSAGWSVPVPYNQSVARISFDPVVASRTRTWLERVDPDVLHLHEPITPSVAVLALWQARTPVMATFHTATPGTRARRFAGRRMPHTLSRIDHGVSVSWVAHDVALSHYGIETEVIGNGIALSDYPEVRTTTRWRGGDHPRVTFIGRYDEQRKGFGVLQAALPIILEAHPDAEIAVVGQGSPIRGAGALRYGRLPDADRDRVLAGTDVYVAPNLGRESFGIILLEALAAGAPVVASDLTAFRDVITDADGPVGRLFPVGDHRALAAEVIASLAEPRDRWLARGRAAASRFDWQVIGPRIVSGYATAESAFRAGRPAPGAAGRA